MLFCNWILQSINCFWKKNRFNHFQSSEISFFTNFNYHICWITCATRFVVPIDELDIIESRWFDILRVTFVSQSVSINKTKMWKVDNSHEKKMPSFFFSRDTILHIKDKPSLFSKFYSTLKAGGQLLITDYCRGDQVNLWLVSNYWLLPDML